MSFGFQPWLFEIRGNRAAERHFGVDEKRREWRANKEEIKSTAGKVTGAQPRRSRRLGVLRKTIMKKARMMYDEMTKNEKENDSKVDSLAGAGLL